MPFAIKLLCFIIVLPLTLHSYEIYLGDLHAHTVFSDGGKTKKIKNKEGKLTFHHDPKATPEFAWKHAKASKAGDFLAITDHHSRPPQWGKPENNISESEWQHMIKYADKLSDDSFLAIAAIETSRTWGHMNTYFSKNLVDAFQTFKSSDYYEQLFKEQPEKVSCFNHANAYGKKENDFNNFIDYDPKYDEVVTMFEVVSGKHLLDHEYYRALDQG